MRRIPLSHRSHIIGFQPLSTGLAEHESALERDFVTLTSFTHPAASITSQPVTISFEDGLTRRRYTPDFLVEYADQPRELVEVKYQADLREGWRRLAPAFTAARAWAQERGATFRIATEIDIRGPRLMNAKRLLPLRAAPVGYTDGDAGTDSKHMHCKDPPSALCSARCRYRALALATLWKLIARGALHADLSVPIKFDSELRPA